MPILGLSVGNYLTSLLYRLPRGKIIANDPPYCDHCHQYLQVRDLFPFFSWVVNKAKCRFCGVPVTALYAVIELSCAAIFTICWLQFGMGESFILVVCINVLLVLLGTFFITQSSLRVEVLLVIAALGAIFRTLQDHTIYGFVKGAYVGALAGLLVYGVLKIIQRQRKQPPPLWRQVILAPTLAGLCFSITLIPSFLMVNILSCLPLLAVKELRGKAWVISGIFSLVSFFITKSF